MKRYIKVGICVMLALAVIGFIFTNSAQKTAESTKVSLDVTAKIETAVERSGLQDTTLSQNVSPRYVRKAAHAVEFFALGATLFLTAVILHKKLRFQAVWNILAVSLFVAVTDESIQILSERGPRVQDILLDFCGAAAAILLCGLVYYGIRAIFRFAHRRAQKRG